MPLPVTLLCGDCLTLMKSIPDKSIDMILCDLPYGVTQNSKDKTLPFDELWKEYTRIITDNGAILLFGQGKFFIDLIHSNRKLYRYDLVWDKQLVTGFLNAKRAPLRRHEQIAVFYKKKPVYNPQFSEGKPLHGKGKGYKEKEAKNENYGKFGVLEDTRKGSTQKYPTSILSFPKSHPSQAKHRTEKPVALLEYLIRTYTDEGVVVLDNCMGAGSTGVAAVRAGRGFIGMEIDENYFVVAKEQIERAVKERESNEQRK